MDLSIITNYLLEIFVVFLIFFILFTYSRSSSRRRSYKLNVAGAPINSTERFCCKVELGEIEENSREVTAFIVKMRGKITVPKNNFDTNVQVLLADVTDGSKKARPVLCSNENWQMEDSPAFCLIAHNGNIPRKVSILHNWVQVGVIPVSCLKFPRSGPRHLKFITSLTSRKNGKEIESSTSSITYDNPLSGYIDERESYDQSESLPVEIALAVGHINGSLHQNVITVLNKWIDEKAENDPDENKQKMVKSLLQNAMNDTIKKFEHSRKYDMTLACRKALQTCSIIDRYNIIRLCLNVIAADGIVTKEETNIIQGIASQIHIDPIKFRAMSQKILPVNTHEIEDTDFLLGLTENMSPEQIRIQLNSEYQKWNARVTHPDAEIQKQADNMLALIADARNKYIHQHC